MAHNWPPEKNLKNNDYHLTRSIASTTLSAPQGNRPLYNLRRIGKIMQEYGSVERNNESSTPTLLEALLDNRNTLIKTAARITGCHSRAEDVVQDAFLRLANTPRMSLPLRAQISYVFRIVRNLAIDHYRKQAMEQKYSGSEEEGLNVAVQGATPESQNLDHEALTIIDAALNELPARTRYAFECYRLHGIAQKDIAKELGVSPTLVNFMIRDAMVHCRKVLHERIQ